MMPAIFQLVSALSNKWWNKTVAVNQDLNEDCDKISGHVGQTSKEFKEEKEAQWSLINPAVMGVGRALIGRLTEEN